MIPTVPQWVSVYSALLTAAGFWFAGSPASGAEDEWTDVTGKFRIAADYVRVEGSSVILRKVDGTEVSIPIARLDPKSRDQAKAYYRSDQQKASSAPAASRRFPFDATLPELSKAAEGNALKRFERWKFRFDTQSMAEHAQLLDHFEIDLAVIGGNRRGMDYLVGIHAPRPSSKNGHPAQEQRLYLIQDPAEPTASWEQELARRAGVPTAGRSMLLLIHAKLENHLAHLERRYCDDHGALALDRIESVQFLFRSSEGDFSIEITEVRLRGEVPK